MIIRGISEEISFNRWRSLYAWFIMTMLHFANFPWTTFKYASPTWKSKKTIETIPSNVTKSKDWLIFDVHAHRCVLISFMLTNSYCHKYSARTLEIRYRVVFFCSLYQPHREKSSVREKRKRYEREGEKRDIYDNRDWRQWPDESSTRW